MKTNFTPGPWSLEKRQDGDVEILAGDDQSPCAIVYGDDNDPLCWPVSANANLIKAAPDMFEALVRIANPHKTIHGALVIGDDDVRAIRASIAKALGE